LKTPLWVAVLLLAGGLGVGWLVWGRMEPPPPPAVIRETHTDTLPERVDTVKIADPKLIAETKRLRGVVAGFLAIPISDTTDTCRAYLAAALRLLDSLERAVTVAPAIRLTLSDTLTAKWPLKALWVGVSYRAAGDTAVTAWHYRQWPAPLAAKSRLGAVFGYGAGNGGFAGAQLRLDQSKALQIAKSEKGWQGALVWYVR